MKEKKPKKIKKPPTPKSKELFAIKRAFIERNFEKEKINWSRELKIINNLFELVPDLEFWKIFNLYQKFNCALWFQADSGKAYILREYDKWIKTQTNEKLVSKEEKKVYNLENHKIGADLAPAESVAKPKSLKDFLNE